MEHRVQLPLDTKAIMEILPHRYPFLMVDRVIAMDEGKSITAIKNVTINEMCFIGHFPGEPVMPGVLILEGMAQTGGILACLSEPSLMGKLVYFAGVDKARFRRIVYPGDQMIYKLEMVKQKGRLIKMAGRTYVDEQLVTEAELMASYP
ncbi:MAG: 3-hydroxyacyl-ACP dehydratase FabZ [Desulfobulbaceae bacterium]|nr:3-hydroxyacyl-ACP dehydratase FabZ [Desulfobulbaceae bacterium]